jgi:hypothetical protein
MKSINVLTAAILLAIPNLSFAEHRISKSDLPVVVSKTADAQSAGAIVVGYAKDVKKGKTEYEVQLMVDGHTKDVTIDAQGNILEVEEQVQQSALPANVLNGLRAQAGKGSMRKIEFLMKHDKIVAYEAQAVAEKRHWEIQVGPNGQKLDHEE